MNSKTIIKGTILPVAMMCSALTFNPLTTVVANAAEQSQHAQGITGTVLDDQGEPIIGATIVILNGSNQGTITDLDGRFKVNVKPGTKLQISYVGYDTQTVVAKNGMKITLKSNTVDMEGVEVVAYGVQKKVTVTGAISSVKSEDLVRTSVSSVNNVLAGQLSGVTTVQDSGEPGADAAKIYVRGQGTWADSSPLIQVDGVEREMWDIDPNDIESITVLKDASATAVFGVRGANGVVLITTKRGKEGKAKINISTTFTALTPTKMIDLANSYEYATYHNQMSLNDGKSPEFSEAVLEKFRTGSDPIRFPSINWADYIMKDVTLQQQHNINISGGNNKVKYFISAGMYTQDGIFKEWGRSWNYGYEYQRFNYRANLDINATKTTQISASISGKVDDKDTPRTGQGASGMIKAIYYATPFCSPGFVDDMFVVNSVEPTDNRSSDPTNKLPFVGSHPMTYYAYQPGGYHNSNSKISIDLALNQKLDFLTQGLSFKLKGAYNTSYNILTTTTASVATYYPVLLEDGETIIYRKTGDNVDPSYKTEQNGKGRNWYMESSFNYNRTFGEHTVSGLLLYNQSKEYYPSTYSDLARTYVGIAGRATYDFKSRYMAEFNIGYNGSENFAPGKRFGVFPSGSVGWVVSEEKFFEPLKKVVTFVKLRASCGLVGNDKIGGKRYMYLSDPYNVNQAALLERAGKDSGAFGYNFGVENGTVSKGAVEADKNNPDVSWEKAFKQDYGIDMNFLDDRLHATFDYYREHRKDILLQNQTTPTFLGITLPYSNLGEVKSWGWELTLNWNDKIGENFRYWAKMNLSYNQNKIIERYEAPLANEYSMLKNNRIGSRSLYKFWKFYYEGCEEDYKKEFGTEFPNQLVSNIKPGDCVYVDLDKNGKIDADDKIRGLGYTDDPEYICGLTLGFQYMGWSFNTQLTGAWNVSRVVGSLFREPFASAASDSATDGGLVRYHLDHTWTPSNPSQDADYPRATCENAAQNYVDCSLYEKDAKYLRLKTIQLSYDFKAPFMKKIGMTQLQLSLSAYNLLTFTPYIWGDPEARASGSPSYPLQRTYTAGLRVGF